MANLILPADVKAIAEITANIPDAKITRSILLAQSLDIKPAIGDALLASLIANISSVTPNAYLTHLYNGGTYTYSLVDYSHQGIKTACAYYTYARMLMTNQYTLTQYGVVTKTTEESERADSAGLARMINNYQEIAYTYLMESKLYIERNWEQFASYYNYTKQTKRGFNIRTLGD